MRMLGVFRKLALSSLKRERERATRMRPADHYTIASLHANAGQINQEVVDDIMASRRDRDRELDKAIAKTRGNKA